MNNPPAFPRTAGPYIEGESDVVHGAQQGMSLRDYFAAAALQGLFLNRNGSTAQELAEAAYEQADAMLKAREEPQ